MKDAERPGDSAFLDRIEEGQGVFLIDCSREEVVVPATGMPADLEGGTWVRLHRGRDGRVIAIDRDPDEGEKVRERIAGKMKRLRRRKKKT